MTETWAEVKGKEKDFWKPEKIGEERIGTLLRGEMGEFKDRPTMQYVLKLENDAECWTPNHAVLNAKLHEVKVGCKIKIIYQGTGEKKKKGRAPAELYDVFVSDAPRQTGLSETTETKEEFPQPGYVSQAERIKRIMADIRLYCKLDHIIPEEKLMKICGDDQTFKHLRDAGLICLSTWDKVEGWRVVN